MTRLLKIIAVCLLAAPTAQAGQPKTAKAYFEAAEKRYAAALARGLKSFSIELSLVEASRDAVDEQKQMVKFEYHWTAPKAERFDFRETPKAWQKPLQGFMGAMWRDLTGAPFLQEMKADANAKLTRSARGARLTGTMKELGPYEALFERKTYRLKTIEFSKHGLELRFKMISDQGRYRLESKEIWQVGVREVTASYGRRKQINGFILPTTLEVIGKKDTLSFAIKYLKVNGKPAKIESLSDKTIEARARSFEKRWSGWSVADKLSQLKSMAEIDHDKISAVIARKSLRDRSLTVRETGAVVLGKMKRKNVTPQLIRALEANRANEKVYIQVCLALGELNDPRAIRPLSKNWWQHREAGAKGIAARIVAVGKIKHTQSVDALINLITITHKDKLKPYAKYVLYSLKNLTGQDLGPDGRAWKMWWKRNRATHRFK